MKAFLGDQKVKDFYLDRVRTHYENDEIIKGKYWEKGRGCAVGCVIHSSDHKKYETVLGIPQWLAKLEDRLFEALPNERAKAFPLEFLNSIHIGADLNKIKAPFLIFIMESTLDKFDHQKHPNVKSSIDAVIALYKRDDATKEEFINARGAADAADYAADAAAYAADAAAYARQNAYIKFADKLLELLSNCK